MDLNEESVALHAELHFEVEAQLQDLGIPVFHDDQHGTAIVVMAALLNALKVTGKRLDELTVVFNGSGAAALACARLFVDCGREQLCLPVKDVILCDSKGIIHRSRTDLNAHKAELAKMTNARQLTGGLRDAIRGADVFIGLSQASLVDAAMIRSMAPNPIVFAMANPVPEIMPDEVRAAGALVINDLMKVRAAFALADYVIEPTPERVLPDPLDKGVAFRIGEAVARAAAESGVCREPRRGS